MIWQQPQQLTTSAGGIGLPPVAMNYQQPSPEGNLANVIKALTLLEAVLEDQSKAFGCLFPPTENEKQPGIAAQTPFVFADLWRVLPEILQRHCDKININTARVMDLIGRPTPGPA